MSIVKKILSCSPVDSVVGRHNDYVNIRSTQEHACINATSKYGDETLEARYSSEPKTNSNVKNR